MSDSNLLSTLCTPAIEATIFEYVRRELAVAGFVLIDLEVDTTGLHARATVQGSSAIVAAAGGAGNNAEAEELRDVVFDADFTSGQPPRLLLAGRPASRPQCEAVVRRADRRFQSVVYRMAGEAETIRRAMDPDLIRRPDGVVLDHTSDGFRSVVRLVPDLMSIYAAEDGIRAHALVQALATGKAARYGLEAVVSTAGGSEEVLGRTRLGGIDDVPGAAKAPSLADHLLLGAAADASMSVQGQAP